MCAGKRDFVFTADVVSTTRRFSAARFEDVKADVLIMETTRGTAKFQKILTRESEIERLVAAIHNALKRKGSVLDPGICAGRTQEILAIWRC